MKKLIASILLAAAVLLAASFGLNGIAARNAQAEHLRLMQTILPGSTEFAVEPYDGEDANIVCVHRGETGWVIETTVYGYAGDITMLTAVSNEGSVVGLVVRDMQETLGLGAQALTDHEFLAQFLNGSGEFAVATSGADAFSAATGTDAPAGETTDVDAITGATVTSKAIVRSINSAVAYVTGADISSGATSWGG